MEYVVVDIETTGLNVVSDRVIEIGIVVLNEFEISETYQFMINPQKPIPRSITNLTGITDQMARSGSIFSDIASELKQIFNKRIFVAHRVEFDFNFIAAEFKRCKIGWNPSGILCTAELSKRLFPKKKSHSLKSLSKISSYRNPRPHRALPDAQTAAAFLIYLKSRYGVKTLENVLHSSITDLRVEKPKLNRMIEGLPESAGVYYMIDKYNRPIYIGKAKNIRSRIKSHFSGSDLSSELLKGYSKITRIDHVETGNELLSSIIEDHEIRKYWPIYNRAQKLPVYKFTIHVFKNGSGVWRMTIAKSIRKLTGDHYYSKDAAIKKIKEHVLKFDLEPSFCGLMEEKGINITEHNLRFENFIRHTRKMKPSYKYFVSANKIEKMNPLILFKDHKLHGIGFTQMRAKNDSINQIEKFMKINSSIMCENIIDKEFSKPESDFIEVKSSQIKIPSSKDNGITPNFKLEGLLF